MKYGDLPTTDVARKLAMISFDVPSINLWAYKFTEAVSKHYAFAEAEREKLVRLYGEPNEDGAISVTDENMQDFREKMLEILDMEIDVSDIPTCEISEQNFSEGRCLYAKDAQTWMNANDIRSILKFMDKLKEGEA